MWCGGEEGGGGGGACGQWTGERRLKRQAALAPLDCSPLLSPLPVVSYLNPRPLRGCPAGQGRRRAPPTAPPEKPAASGGRRCGGVTAGTYAVEEPAGRPKAAPPTAGEGKTHGQAGRAGPVVQGQAWGWVAGGRGGVASGPASSSSSAAAARVVSAVVAARLASPARAAGGHAQRERLGGCTYVRMGLRTHTPHRTRPLSFVDRKMGNGERKKTRRVHFLVLEGQLGLTPPPLPRPIAAHARPHAPPHHALHRPDSQTMGRRWSPSPRARRTRAACAANHPSARRPPGWCGAYRPAHRPSHPAHPPRRTTSPCGHRPAPHSASPDPRIPLRRLQVRGVLRRRRRPDEGGRRHRVRGRARGAARRGAVGHGQGERDGG